MLISDQINFYLVRFYYLVRFSYLVRFYYLVRFSYFLFSVMPYKWHALI